MTDLVLLGPSEAERAVFKILSPKGSEEQVPQSSPQSPKPGLFTKEVLKKPIIEGGGVG